jgi:hypothetical protein
MLVGGFRIGALAGSKENIFDRPKICRKGDRLKKSLLTAIFGWFWFFTLAVF